MTMLPSLLILLTLAAAPASEPAPAGSAASATPEASFADALEAGKQLYFGGQPEDALEALLALRVRVEGGEEVPREYRADMFVWLGEIQYHLGRTDDARESFRSLLRGDPEYAISPYAHPLDVVGEFELVRREVLGERDQPVFPTPTLERPPPAPAWVWAPLGVPQFAQRRVGAGLVLGGLQLGLGAASVAMHVHIARNNRDPTIDGLPDTGIPDEEVPEWTNGLRYRVQWPLTFAFYGAWLTSSLEARHHWRKQHRTTLTVGPMPRGGSGVLVTSEF